MQDRPVVLVVEDDSLVRLVVVLAVEQAGFAVLEAANADEALVLLEAEPAIRVVFTDVKMPGPLNGLALARRVRDTWPGVVVVVTSGNAWVDPSELPPGAQFLPKPYLVERFTALIAPLLS